LRTLVSGSLAFHVLDLVGTAAFAISGATAGVRHGFDLFGVLVLAFVTAVSGGIVRDLLIGSVPPAALRDWHYLAAALLAGILTFWFSRAIQRIQHPVQIFDAMGLALFAVVGTNKALAFGLDWPIAAILGMLSGIGGGMLRDVLCAEVPGVLRAEVYAVAALAGGLVVGLGSLLPLPRAVFTAIGAVLCFLLRLFGIYRGWKLPVARR
jgi:uncharacterized membrane protein YeiH